MNIFDKIVEHYNKEDGRGIERLALVINRSTSSVYYKKRARFKWEEAVAINKDTKGKFSVKNIMDYKGSEV